MVPIAALSLAMGYKKEDPKSYEKGFLIPSISKLLNLFPSPTKLPDGEWSGSLSHLKSIYVIGKVQIEINKKLYSIARYVTWTYRDFTTDPVARLAHSTIMIVHLDKFLIDETLMEISALFEKALLWDSSKEDFEELKDRVALVRYLFAYVMPDRRGSAAVGEWLETLLYRAHGYKCTHSPSSMGDLGAFVAPLWSTFRKEKYQKTIALQKTPKEELEIEQKEFSKSTDSNSQK